MDFLVTFVLTFAIFIVIDLIWLGVIARTFYKNQLGHLMAERVNWTAAIVFYSLFIVGLVVFVINPAIDASSVARAFMLGGLFGLIAYATYDLTNLATLKDWPILVTVVDLAWGTALGALTSGLSYLVVQAII